MTHRILDRMNKKEKFKDELIERLYKYNMSVSNFLKEVNGKWFWVEKCSSKKLKELLKNCVEI